MNIVIVSIIEYYYYRIVLLSNIIIIEYHYFSILQTPEPWLTPSPPAKSLGFGGFDSSKLLTLRGGNYHVHKNFIGGLPESSTQGLLVGKLLVGGLGVLASQNVLSNLEATWGWAHLSRLSNV